MKILEDLKLQIAGYYDNMIVFLPKLIVGVIVAYLVYRIMKIFEKRFLKYLDSKTKDKLLINFLDGLINVGLVLFSIFIFLFCIGQTGLASGILGAATLSSIVIGFAFKDIAENFLAGVIMAFNRPFRIGDYVKTGSVEGSIIEMSLRETHLKTSDGKDAYIPNGQIIKTPLFNYTIDGYLRANFTIGIDYSSDIEVVRSTIIEVLNAIPGILKEGKTSRTHVKTLNTNTVDIEVHYWINTFDQNFSGLELKSKAQTLVLEALTKKGVTMSTNIIEIKGATSKVIRGIS